MNIYHASDTNEDSITNFNENIDKKSNESPQATSKAEHPLTIYIRG